jgi:hypothetical protein
LPPGATYDEVHGVVDPAKPARATRLHCAGGTPVAISGFAGADSDSALRSLALTASMPYGHHHSDWVVAVRDLANAPEPYFVGIVCVSAQRRFSFVSRTATLSPGQFGGSTVPCPTSADQPVSGFFSAEAGVAAKLILADFAPSPHAWTTAVKNLSARRQTYVMGAVCAPRTETVRELWSNWLTVRPQALDGGWGRCPTAAPYAVAGAFAVPARNAGELGDITLSGSYPFGAGTRKWTTVVLNLTSHKQPFLVGMVCLR